MQIPMSFQVVQASNYNMDGNTGGNIICLSKPTDEADNRTGLDVVKMTCGHEVKDQLKGLLPCDCDLVVEMVQGSQNKSTLKLIKITPKPKAARQ